MVRNLLTKIWVIGFCVVEPFLYGCTESYSIRLTIYEEKCNSVCAQLDHDLIVGNREIGVIVPLFVISRAEKNQRRTHQPIFQAYAKNN